MPEWQGFEAVEGKCNRSACCLFSPLFKLMNDLRKCSIYTYGILFSHKEE
jgi:hypothetical protein